MIYQLNLKFQHRQFQWPPLKLMKVHKSLSYRRLRLWICLSYSSSWKTSLAPLSVWGHKALLKVLLANQTNLITSWGGHLVWSKESQTPKMSNLLKIKFWERGKEKLKENLKYWDQNSRKTLCGPERASRKWGNYTRKILKCQSNRSTNGGGTKPERDLRKPQERKTSTKPLTIARTVPDKMKMGALYLSKTSLGATPPDWDYIKLIIIVNYKKKMILVMEQT